MTKDERTVIDQALRYQNDYRNIEALARLAERVIRERDKLRKESGK